MTYKASMEMVGSCVKVEDDGTTSIVKHVLFTDTEGNEVKYPWQALKEVVIEWMKVESEEWRDPWWFKEPTSPPVQQIKLHGCELCGNLTCRGTCFK